jgi:hypothetical protein
VTPSPAANQARVNWRRMNLNVSYSIIRAQNNSGGFFEVSPTGNVEDDWGPGPADQPYRVQILLTSTQIRNVTIAGTFLANSGQVYNWTTGFDDNRDGIVNDRPAGVGLHAPRLRSDDDEPQGGVCDAAGRAAEHRDASGPPLPAHVFANATLLTTEPGRARGADVAFFRQPTLANNLRGSISWVDVLNVRTLMIAERRPAKWPRSPGSPDSLALRAGCSMTRAMTAATSSAVCAHRAAAACAGTGRHSVRLRELRRHDQA